MDCHEMDAREDQAREPSCSVGHLTLAVIVCLQTNHMVTTPILHVMPDHRIMLLLRLT
jgi:hypothetical protein